jgi:uncharacterized protein (TIGR02246 family)
MTDADGGSDGDGGLRRLLDQAAIRDVVARYARGIDRGDLELVRDCYHPDGTDRHPGFDGARDDYVAWLVGALARHTFTQHVLANTLIDLAGDVAAVETYAVAYHAGDPPEDPRSNFAAGFRYLDRFERRDGRWRIAARVVAAEWTMPWHSDPVRRARLGVVGRRGPDDPLYDLAAGVPGAPMRGAAPA